MEQKRENRLSDFVLQRIQSAIVSGEFQKGELLPSEREMSIAYGVGKSSVREAIKMLQVLGIVDSAQGKGTYLRAPDAPLVIRPLLLKLLMMREDLFSLYEFRKACAKSVISLAAAKANEKALEEAKKAFSRLESSVNLSDSEREKADLCFHQSIIEAADNVFISNVGQLAIDLCMPYLSLRRDPERRKEEVEAHRRVLEMVCSGDLSELEEAVSDMLRDLELGQEEAG